MATASGTCTRACRSGSSASCRSRAGRFRLRDALSLEVRAQRASHGLALGDAVALLQGLEALRNLRIEVEAVQPAWGHRQPEYAYLYTLSRCHAERFGCWRFGAFISGA